MYEDNPPEPKPENTSPELLTYSYFGCTDVGLVRKTNEDVYLDAQTVNGSLFVVCDGMGGHSRGKLAAKTAADQALAILNSQYFDEPSSGLHTAIVYANQEIANLNHNKIEFKRMGTTIVCALIRNQYLYYANVGDSRLYLLRRGVLTQLSQDHSYVQQLVAGGIITPEEARHHPQRNHLTQAVGIAYNIEPAVGQQAIECLPNDLFLLCSDGINEMLDDTALQQLLLEEESLQEKAEHLIEQSKELGAEDNLTVLLIRIH